MPTRLTRENLRRQQRELQRERERQAQREAELDAREANIRRLETELLAQQRTEGTKGTSMYTSEHVAGDMTHFNDHRRIEKLRNVT